MSNQSNTLLLSGIDGSNPLGFLSALGVLKVLDEAWSQRDLTMNWDRVGGAWRPELTFRGDAGREEVVDALYGGLDKAAVKWELPIEKNCKLTPMEYRALAQQVIASEARADLVAALATDGALQKRGANAGKVVTSQLQMVNGGKRQDYIPIIQNVVAACDREHVDRTVFEEWRYEDSMQGLNLRWDPSDDRQYALRWRNPSDSQTRKSGSQLGANRLAIEAIPLFTLVGSRGGARTVGFAKLSTGRVASEWFRWPIWNRSASLPIVRSLLTRPEAVVGQADTAARQKLRAVGIAEVFTARRYAVDKYQTASFAAAAPV